MRWKSIVWFVVSLLCFVAAWYAWQWGERRAGRDVSRPEETVSPAPSTSAATGAFQLVSQPAANTNATQPGATGTTAAVAYPDTARPYRLRNTPAPLSELMRSDTAVLLENALVDTARRETLPVPEHLRAQGDPGAYIVQARGAITEAFRQLIAGAGGSVVSYVPNNAYLVRAPAGAASVMGASPLTRAVLPFEPYYKLKGDLLKLAVDQKALPAESVLTVVLFPDAASATMDALTQMGGRIVAEDRSPFGPVLKMQAPAQGLSAVAGLSGVQIVDRAYTRVSATDLTRERLGVATTSTVPINYLGLTGSNVLVQVVDSGVYAAHPDLSPRVVGAPPSLTDTDGHGTHVAGIIAGDGSQSAGLTDVSGSVTPTVTGQFRGMAPEARIYSIGAIGGNFPATDRELQETAAITNALISNNSWRQLGNTAYDITAASYDAAVRDALPLTNGSQPVLFVFAAGNEGDGNDDGTGGIPDTIGSPATAKNVITVGAIEQFRNITNDVTICPNGTNNPCDTEMPFAARTDSDNQVAYYSSRGNVGIGLEGLEGRRKPDVVAPGEFVVSTAPVPWDTNAYYYPTNYIIRTYPNPDDLFPLPNPPIGPGLVVAGVPVPSADIPLGTFEWTITVDRVWDADNQTLTNVDVPIYVRNDRVPQVGDTPQGLNSYSITAFPDDVTWYVGFGNPSSETIWFQYSYTFATTNLTPFKTKGLQQENSHLAPYYRYESGTSMAAPAVSGVLALLQGYYEEQFPNKRPSPALLKALLINGARPLAPYVLGDVVEQNAQGWGLVNLPNVVPALTNVPSGSQSALHFYEETVTNALATGQQQTRTVTINPAVMGQASPLHFTLVWTDPPGNPLVSTKLVNDLDLIVTNLVTGDVFFGNYFDSQGNFSEALPLNPTNNFAITNLDVVNNVENIILSGSTNVATSSQFSVTVVGRRVNVNSVNTDPNNTVQDYALVVSYGNGTAPTALTMTDGAPTPMGSAEVNFLTPIVETETNQSYLALNQRAGENSPLLGDTNGIADSVNSGVTNQWRFYAVSNSFEFTNAVFVTFLPPTLSIPRMGVFDDDLENATRLQADIDLYVTQDATITNLDPTAINNAIKSRGPSGTESIVLSNALPGIYYVGVKSEDHEAAEFSFFAAFTLLPISSEDETGVTLQGIPVPAAIPDGPNSAPGAALVLAVSPTPLDVRKVIVTNSVSHPNMGDLIGNFSHDNRFVVLNNHTWPEGNQNITNYTYVYDDMDDGEVPNANASDGPGSLRRFVGEPGVGVWLLTMVDDNYNQSNGVVRNLIVRVEKSADTNAVIRTLPPGGSYIDFVEVPGDGTNLTICVDTISSTPLPVQLFIKRGEIPTTNPDDADVFEVIDPPGECVSISQETLPPLQPGTYYYRVFNPNAIAQEVRIQATVQIGVDGRDRQTITGFGNEVITDDAVSYARQYVEEDRRIAGLEVGLVVEHPRVSDLVTHLISPSGKRILLVENRGGLDDSGYGGGTVFTNVYPTNASGTFEAVTNVLNVGANQGTLKVTYDFLVVPDQMRVYYDNQLIKDTGLVSGQGGFSVDFGPGFSTDLVIVMNEGDNENTNSIWSYTATVIGRTLSYLVLTEDEDKTSTPIKFAIPPLGGLNVNATGTVVFADGFDTALPNVYPAGTFIGGWEVITNDVEVLTGDASSPPNFLDINGNVGPGIIQTNLALTSGRNYQLSFDYARNPNPSAQVLLGSTVDSTVQPTGTNSWTNLMWQTFAVPFTVTDTNQLLQIVSLFPGTNGVLFDNFRIVEAAELDRYYFPEESLDELLGDRSQGWWTLELWDNRAGASNGPPTVVSWQLRFIYETVVQLPIVVKPGVAITNTIPAGQILQLQVQVPDWANFATNTLLFATPDPVNVWFNQDMPPALGGTNTNDFPLLLNSLGGTALLNTEGVPPLQPGRTYYVGIENPGTNTVTVAFRVDFDITLLTAGVPFDGTLGTNSFGGRKRMFVYNVTTNTPEGLLIDLFNLTNDVNMRVRYGQVPETTSDYQSYNSGTNDEQVTILTDSAPVPLVPGPWYIEVSLASAALPASDYTLLVTEFTNLPPNIITLTNGIAYFNSNNGVSPIEDYYRFIVTDPVMRLQFEILGPTADMTLLVSKGLPLPSLANFDYLSANPGTNDEFILVLPGSSPVVPSSGEWFLTALNLSGQTADYGIRATQWAQTGQPSFCFSWNSLPGASYVVQAKTALSDTNWIDHSGTIYATDFVTTYCVALPSPYSFFRVMEGVALDTGAVAQVRITGVSVGPGGVTITWQAPPTYQFSVEYKDQLSLPTWTLAGSGITSTNGTFTFTDNNGGMPLPPTRFYRLVVE